MRLWVTVVVIGYPGQFTHLTNHVREPICCRAESTHYYKAWWDPHEHKNKHAHALMRQNMRYTHVHSHVIHEPYEESDGCSFGQIVRVL